MEEGRERQKNGLKWYYKEEFFINVPLCFHCFRCPNIQNKIGFFHSIFSSLGCKHTSLKRKNVEIGHVFLCTPPKLGFQVYPVLLALLNTKCWAVIWSAHGIRQQGCYKNLGWTFVHISLKNHSALSNDLGEENFGDRWKYASLL